MQLLSTHFMTQVIVAIVSFGIGLSVMALDSKEQTILANQGDASAQNKLGFIYERG